jgi:2,4-dienoyl-CoA reductase (NADPH2)
VSQANGFSKLLEPGQIGKVRTRNRIYKSAAATFCFSDTEFDSLNDNVLSFYGALARGGVGIISMETPTVDFPHGCRYRARYRMDDDKYIPGMKILVDLIHSHGCPTFLQMEHEAPWQNPLLDGFPATYEGPPMGASAVKITSLGDCHRDLIRPLAVPEIQEIVQKYINAAERAQKAGYDGVDLNMASSHVVHNFLSPFWNRRDDEYGGTQKKRARFLIEIITGIKERCGTDFPIVVCLNGFETGYPIGVDDDKCLGHEQGLENAKWAVEAGADAVMVRSHWLGLHVPGYLTDHMFYPEAQVPVDSMSPHYYAKERGKAAMRLLSEEYKKVLGVPIILIGYVTPELGEQMLEQGKTDFVGMNRPLFCDPDLPNKLKAGRPKDIRPCTRCGTCLNRSGEEVESHCRANAAFGFGYPDLEKAPTKKKVVVVGGGPAGMEAARVAAERGHNVTLVEKASHLGGLMPLAGLIKGLELEDLPALVRWFGRQLDQSGVKVELGTEATAETIRALGADAVILATGGGLNSPLVEGEKSKVVTMPELHKRVKPWLRLFGPRVLGWATRYWLPIGKKVVVVGAGLHGMEMTEFLVKRGRTVTVLEPTKRIGEGCIDFRLGLLMNWLERKGVTIITEAKNIRATTVGVSYEDKDGFRHEIEAETVMPTAPLLPNEGLYKALEGKVPELYLIGDGKEAGMIVNAIRSGYQTARLV